MDMRSLHTLANNRASIVWALGYNNGPKNYIVSRNRAIFTQDEEEEEEETEN